MNPQPPQHPTVLRLLNRNVHPGLCLDKYAASWLADPTQGAGNQKDVQYPTLTQFVNLSSRLSSKLDYPSLFNRRQAVLSSLRATFFEHTTAAPLAIHLSRATALENGGIALHHLYGFAFLPATGLKGLAHAFACEIWLPQQPDRHLSWQTICRIFGAAPSPWLRDLAARLGVNIPNRDDGRDASFAGTIVFHEAWATKVPRLIVDIVNCHHSKYYAGEANARPGDWENPVPVYSPAVAPETTFHFALSPRRDGADPDIELARSWLEGGLQQLGFGAKTNAGYGHFAAQPVQLPQDKFAVFSTTLELVTPAFLAGASQQRDDCELRPATLRGQLRWWWRTMHAEYLSLENLRHLEAAIWGSASQGGAIQIHLQTQRKSPAQEFDIKDGSRIRQQFAQHHGRRKPAHNKTTPGLLYLAYGMNEKSHGQRRIRWYLEPGAQWRITFTARPTTGPLLLSAAQVLQQATAALWLLCTFGGVGSRCRKGFGSLTAAEPKLSIETCLKKADALRRELKLPEEPEGAPKETPSLLDGNDLHMQITLSETDVWACLDRIGYAYRQFTQAREHDPAKRALGLPRKINGPSDRPMPGQSNHRPPEQLRAGPYDRLASPVHLHLSRGPRSYTLDALAMPSACLGGEAFHLLGTFLDHLKKQLAVAPQR
jgi:CRISPR-associated protein Cmr6